MKYFNNKISELIEGQLPNFLQEEGPKFIKFVEKYYEWMETSKLEVSVSEELDLDFSGNTLYKIVGSRPLVENPAPDEGEEKYLKKVYAEVLNSYRLDSGNYVFFIKEYEQNDVNVPVTRGFSSGDDINFIMGNSGYSGSIQVVSYIQNVNLSSKNIWNLQDIDRTLDDYVDFFMKEYLEGFPLSFPNQLESTDLDVHEFKKFLVKHSREFYQSKGTEDSFKYFFRTIFNEEVNLKYPKEDIFKPSDNTFENSKVLNIKPSVNTFPDVISKKITGSISGSTAYVERIARFKKGGYEVFEIILNKSSISGEFKLNELVLDDNGVSFGTVYYGGTDVEILNSPESFTQDEIFYISRSGQVLDYSSLSNNDRGSVVELVVCEINSGKITGIDHTPSDISSLNIQEGDSLEFNNSNCFKENGLKRTIIASVDKILIHEILQVRLDDPNETFIVGDTIIQDTGGGSTNEIARAVVVSVKNPENDIQTIRVNNIVGEFRDNIDPEFANQVKIQKLLPDETLSKLGTEIVDVTDDSKILFKFDREGKGYIKHPTITKIGNADVSTLNFEFISSNVGTIKTAKVREQGVGYTVSIISYSEDDWNQNYSNLILGEGEIGVNTDRGLFKIGNGQLPWKFLSYDSRPWDPNLIFGSSYLEVNLKDPNSLGFNDVRIKVSSIYDDGGRFLNNKSFISDSKVIQDSKFYQTFSYLIETSVQVNRFKDLLKRLIHPAGMEMFGNILLESQQSTKIVSQDLKVVIEVIIQELYGSYDSNELPINSIFKEVTIEDFQKHLNQETGILALEVVLDDSGSNFGSLDTNSFTIGSTMKVLDVVDENNSVDTGITATVLSWNSPVLILGNYSGNILETYQIQNVDDKKFDILTVTKMYRPFKETIFDLGDADDFSDTNIYPVTPPPDASDGNDDSFEYIIDGGGSGEFKEHTVLSTKSSIDKIYQIYKIKYRNLIAAPENESEHYKWGKLEERRVVKITQWLTNPLVGENVLVSVHAVDYILGELESFKIKDGVLYLTLIPNLNFEDEYPVDLPGDPILFPSVRQEYYDPNNPVYNTSGGLVPNITWGGDVKQYTNPYEGLSVSIESDIDDVSGEEYYKVSTDTIESFSQILNIGEMFTVSKQTPSQKIFLNNFNGGVFSNGNLLTSGNKSGTILKIKDLGQGGYCLQIDNYTGDFFVKGETLYFGNISAEVVSVEIIQNQLFKVKYIDDDDNFIKTVVDSSIEVTSGELNLLLEA